MDRKTTGWKVIFITGKSEFSKGDPEYSNAISLAKKEGIDIYTLGIQISTGDPTTSEERNALLSEMQANNGFGQLQETEPSVRKFIGDGISRVLSGSGGYYAGPVARNVTIIESIYSYLSPVGWSAQPFGSAQLIGKPIVNPDRSTTMKFNLGDLKGGETKTIRIQTALDLSKLPVDINKSKTRVDFSPDTNTPPSIMTYTSLIDTPRSVDLPEGQLNIFCGKPCQPEAKIPPASPSLASNNTSAVKPPEVKKQPGFEAWIAIVGLLGVSYLFGRKKGGA